MRIVAGLFRGRPIDAPEGRDTRPTTDRVREALFSSLYSMRGGLDDAVVLDAFAGSGALGLEALSRGARCVVFYERDQKAFDVLRKNVGACRVEAKANVRNADVLREPPTCQAVPFDVVFLDPPYAMEPSDVLDFVTELVGQGSVADDAIVVYEHAHDRLREVGECASERRLTVSKTKKYGKTAVTIFRV